MAEARVGVLCMAYGSPEGEAGIEAYYTHIRGGRPPSPEALAELSERYRAIGGSPLAAITRRQAAALSEQLGLPAWVGFKHAPPFIEEVAAEARAAGVTRLVGLPLAPHFARMSLGGYQQALAASWESELVFVPGFHDHPAFIAAQRTLLGEALARYRPDRLFFTAHSLPARILAEGDGYLDQLLHSCRLVAEGQQLPPWEFAFQSASTTGEPWLGPDLLEAVAASGAGRVLVCPIGFVADHLEVLYDLDVEAQDFAAERGIEIRRTASFNDRPEFVGALAAIVRDALGQGATTISGTAPPDGTNSTPDPRVVKVLIVDDHLMVAQMLSTLLGREPDLQVIGAAGTLREALELVAGEVPDVVVLDFHLPDADGREATTALKKAAPHAAVVILSSDESVDALFDAVSAGAAGFLQKQGSLDGVPAAIRRAADGEMLVPAATLGELLVRGRDEAALRAEETDGLQALSVREAEILALLANGLDSRSIAEALGIGLATVRWHVQHILEKLDSHSKLEAVIRAERLGLIAH